MKPLIQDYKKKERFSKNDDGLFKTTNKKLTKKRVDCFDKFLTEQPDDFFLPTRIPKMIIYTKTRLKKKSGTRYKNN